MLGEASGEGRGGAEIGHLVQASNGAARADPLGLPSKVFIPKGGCGRMLLESLLAAAGFGLSLVLTLLSVLAYRRTRQRRGGTKLPGRKASGLHISAERDQANRSKVIT